MPCYSLSRWLYCADDRRARSQYLFDGYVYKCYSECVIDPVAIDTGLKSIQADWSPDGAVIAITGVQDNINYCQFISQEGTVSIFSFVDI